MGAGAEAGGASGDVGDGAVERGFASLRSVGKGEMRASFRFAQDDNERRGWPGRRWAVGAETGGRGGDGWPGRRRVVGAETGASGAGGPGEAVGFAAGVDAADDGEGGEIDDGDEVVG